MEYKICVRMCSIEALRLDSRSMSRFKALMCISLAGRFHCRSTHHSYYQPLPYIAKLVRSIRSWFAKHLQEYLHLKEAGDLSYNESVINDLKIETSNCIAIPVS